MIVLFIIFSVFLRFISLNQSLWLDEAVTAKVAQTIPFFQIPSVFSPNDFHPPLYYLLISAWSSLFGTNEIALRFPSLLFSILTVWFVYLIGKKIQNKEIGLFAALLFLLNPLVMYYAQEARMYMMTTALLTGVLYAFIILNKSKSSQLIYIILFSVLSALSVATFYGSLFFLVPIGVVYVYNLGNPRGWKQIDLRLFIGVLLALIILFPLILKQLQNARIGLETVNNWSLVLGKAELKNLLLIPLKFSLGRISWFPKWSYYLVGGVVSILTLFFVYKGAQKRKLLFFLLIGPLVLGTIVSFFTPMLQYFRFLYLLPLFCLLLAIGVYEYRYVKWVVLVIFLFFSLLYLVFPSFHREDWKQLAKELLPTVPVYMILPSSDPLWYYRPQLTLFELRALQTKQITGTITVIPYVEELYGFDHKSILNSKGCIQIFEKQYRGFIREDWSCKILVRN